MIEVVDNKLTYSDREEIYDWVLSSSFKYNRISSQNSTQRTFVSEYSLDEIKKSKLFNFIQSKFYLRIKNLRIHRMYTNICNPGEYYEMHVDSNLDDQITILYYPNMEWDKNHGGETVFYDQDGLEPIKMVNYIPGRLILFDSKIPHRSNTVNFTTSNKRFSVAIKLLNKNDTRYYLNDRSLERTIIIPKNKTTDLDKFAGIAFQMLSQKGEIARASVEHACDVYRTLINHDFSQGVCAAGFFDSIRGIHSKIDLSLCYQHIEPDGVEILKAFNGLETRTHSLLSGENIPKDLRKSMLYIEWAKVDSLISRNINILDKDKPAAAHRCVNLYLKSKDA